MDTAEEDIAGADKADPAVPAEHNTAGEDTAGEGTAAEDTAGEGSSADCKADQRKAAAGEGTAGSAGDDHEEDIEKVVQAARHTRQVPSQFGSTQRVHKYLCSRTGGSKVMEEN